MDQYKGKPFKINSEVLKVIKQNSAKQKSMARHYLEFELKKETISEEAVEQLAMLLAVNGKHVKIINNILLSEEEDGNVEVHSYELLTITASVRELLKVQEALEATGYSFKFN